MAGDSAQQGAPGHYSGFGVQDSIAVAVAIAAGTVAYAGPVRFENAAGFEWEFGSYLDITSPGSAQDGVGGGAGTFEMYEDTEGYYQYGSYYLEYHESQVRSGADTGVFRGDFFFNIYTVDQGQEIPTELDQLDQSGFDFYSNALIGYTIMEATYFQTYLPSGSFYMAVNFDLADGTHYGWISVDRDDLGSPRGFDSHLTPLAWGYETEPNTPIAVGAVPAPGTTAALAFGAAAGLLRPRRKAES